MNSRPPPAGFLGPVAAQPKEILYDGPCKRMDGGLDGRTNGYLGGACRTGSGGRRD